MQNKMKIVYTDHAMMRLIERNISKAEITRTVKKAKKDNILKHNKKIRLYNPNHNLYIGACRKHNLISIMTVFDNNKKIQRHTNKVVC